MIDYFSHIAALRQSVAGLAALTATDPALLARRDETLGEVKTEADYATLGALVDHLLAHAVSDGSELALVEDASTLWAQGLALYAEYGTARAQIEAAFADPSAPDSLSTYNAAISKLTELRDASKALAAQVPGIRDRALKRKWLRDHPRQRDAAIASWDWSNLALARRTDAFVRAVFTGARTTAERAFAFGAMSSYAANVTGSAFLGQVVGGPRRSHRFRDRLARNTVGAWLAQQLSLPTLTSVADSIRFGGFGGVALPSRLSTLLGTALKDVYKRTDTPDLDLGLRRMVRHLELLDSFTRPNPPAAPSPDLFDPNTSSSTPVLQTLSDAVSDPSSGGVGSGGTTTTSTTTTGADSQSKSGDACLLLFAALVTFGLVILINCIIQWTKKDGPCHPLEFDPDDPPDENEPTATTSGQLTALAGGPAHSDIVQSMYGLQMMMWQAFDAAYSFLAVSGLVYPDGFLMGSPLYQQFTTVPSVAGWPHRPALDQDAYHVYPTSSIEHPAVSAAPFAAGMTPFAFLFGGGGSFAADVWSVARPVWLQIVRHELDTQNLDADADRGFSHPCWRVAPGTSINDDPISGQNLTYNEI